MKYLWIFLLSFFVFSCSNEPSEREKELEKELLEAKAEVQEVKAEAEKEKKKSPEQLRKELAQKEASNPTQYLRASGKWWVNIVSSTVIEGNVYNDATAVKFKDIKVKAIFKTKTGTTLGEKTFTLYEFISPGRSVHFKEKFPFWYEDCESLNLEVVGAEPV